jgi:hypothetical protein
VVAVRSPGSAFDLEFTTALEKSDRTTDGSPTQPGPIDDVVETGIAPAGAHVAAFGEDDQY